jgi:hypothetical protein
MQETTRDTLLKVGLATLAAAALIGLGALSPDTEVPVNALPKRREPRELYVLCLMGPEYNRPFRIKLLDRTEWDAVQGYKYGSFFEGLEKCAALSYATNMAQVFEFVDKNNVKLVDGYFGPSF